MKKILFFAAAAFAFSACGGTVDPNQGDDPNNPQDIPEELTAPFTLAADKTEVEASGSDYVTFQLLDAYGRDVLADSKALQRVNIVSEEGQRVDRMQTKTRFIANGTYHFTAKYNGVASENTVEIVAKNRGKYEKFHKNVAIYKATGTWCPACPSMTSALKGISDDAKKHSVELCWHSGDEVTLNMGGANDCGTLVAAHLSGGSVAFPTCVFDLVDMSMERSSAALQNIIWDLRAEYPATCGIKASAKIDADGKLNVEAELTSATGGEYDFACAVLLNDQEIMGGTAPDNMYTHIVCAATPNYLMYSTAIKNVAKDATLSFSQNIELGNLNPDDLSVAVFALVKGGVGARIDNIVEVKVGESIDYVYNE